MNILFLVHRAPHPPNKGDRIRSFHLLKHLASRGNVHLAAFADEPVTDDSVAALKSLCSAVEIIQVDRRRWMRAGFSLLRGASATEGLFGDPRMTALLQRWASAVRFDAGIGFCSSMAPYLESLELPKRFVDLVDVDSEKFLQYSDRASPPKRWLYALEGRRLQALERRIGEFADKVALATAPEAELYRRIAPHADVLAIPNGVDFEFFTPLATTPDVDSCIFVGAMDYRANVEGVVWFADHVWSEVRKRRPTAEFRIVGRRPTADVTSLQKRPGVVVAADVADVRPHFERGMVTVAPLRVARGVQNKVLEAMAMGRPVLSSPEAAIGLGVEHDRELLLADDPERWVGRLLKLWDDAELRRRLGAAGRRYVEANHCWDACLAPWSTWLDGVPNPAPRSPLLTPHFSGVRG